MKRKCSFDTGVQMATPRQLQFGSMDGREFRFVIEQRCFAPGEFCNRWGCDYSKPPSLLKAGCANNSDAPTAACLVGTFVWGEESKKGNKVGTKANKVGPRIQKWEQERNKVGTKWPRIQKWEQERNKVGTKGNKVGPRIQKWEQERKKVGTKGNKVGPRIQKWEQERNKVGTKGNKVGPRIQKWEQERNKVGPANSSWPRCLPCNLSRHAPYWHAASSQPTLKKCISRLQS